LGDVRLKRRVWNRDIVVEATVAEIENLYCLIYLSSGCFGRSPWGLLDGLTTLVDDCPVNTIFL
jgi:hypothetical protein